MATVTWPMVPCTMHKTCKKADSHYENGHLGKGQLANNVQLVVGYGDLSIVLHPPLASENIVDARRRFIPRVMLFMPTG